MAECIFLAGATGAIGRRLAPLYVAAGWRVVGTTRSAQKAALLRELGV
jgi:nucleoside-diphosphate-sugar epimerase